MDSMVLVGGRREIRKPGMRSLPELFVENEENLRQRKDISHSTPSKTLSPDGKRARSRIDSGYTDSWNSTASFNTTSHSTHSTNRKTRLEDPTYKDDSLWNSFSSPVLNMKKKLSGRPSFIDEPIKFQIEPQNVVSGILTMVMVSSICFSLFMGFNVNTNVGGKLNGKHSSVKFGSERRIEALKEQGGILDFDIKDEFGNVLGGKRASIQFAYDKLLDEELARGAGESAAPRVKRSVDQPQPAAKAKASVSEPVPRSKDMPQNLNKLSILELSKKIEELSILLQDDDLSDELVEDVIAEIELIKERKRTLLKKIQRSNKVQTRNPPKPVKPEPSIGYVDPAPEPSKGGEKSGKPASKAKTEGTAKGNKGRSVKQPKTKATNPLTGNSAKPSKATKVVDEPVPLKPAVPEQDEPQEEAKDDNEANVEDVDDVDLDYPDDPNFRNNQIEE
eukprot:TRINITY_DN4447_c0_g1_i1.p1 TRINITY_DN4447_c0_g1~~TRINITY_DN4447_c0_g1_i1.p1  ORF type:complete len:448 (+),score=90.71 TRINITY_DN4447_c0_g1_i1:34-1377(+)